MKAIKNSSLKLRRKYDQIFKREAVNNWLSSGKSAEVVSEELGLSPGLLFAWKRRFAPADAGGGAVAGAKPPSYADLQAQLEAALRENRHVREQCYILKKTLGILSEPPTNALNAFTR